MSIIEPAEPMRRVLAKAAENAFFWQPAEIQSSPSVDETVRRAAAMPPDLLVVGPGLSIADGLDLLGRLRSDDGGERIRTIVLLSAEDLALARQRFAALGVRDFLAKPIDMRVLVDLIRTCATRSGLYQAVVPPPPSSRRGGSG